ncbi:DUF2787 family protein [Rheinheimera sp. 1928-s]|uniref:DUF2787 family protein n=1 Tax=Rheinheimera sp. 1928-s TaxID=3033803 RepID=UPI0026050DFD|nr:DUF2787 family protein [Rheinheimera sp. 1928-s]MDF3124678.1 DUF2787 family protein [Rheinheimera sp. 1928-s]
MNIDYKNLPLPVSEILVNHLTDLLKNHDLSNTSTVTINFRDPDYCSEKGGYHPVEIMLFRRGDTWHFAYITDFKYVGQGQDVELAKDLDFDFQAGVFQTLHGYYRIEEGLDIYQVWEENFITYSSTSKTKPIVEIALTSALT